MFGDCPTASVKSVREHVVRELFSLLLQEEGSARDAAAARIIIHRFDSVVAKNLQHVQVAFLVITRWSNSVVAMQ